MKAIIVITGCFIGLLIICFLLFFRKKNGLSDTENNHKIIIPLSQLPQGRIAIIEQIVPQCKGVMRNRLLDLGFVRGSKISLHLTSPMQNPKAYLIRNTIIALRDEQAQYILVNICTNANLNL